MYRGEFTFHPVGQGCFYTGELFSDKARLFNFVYDCGTNSEQSYIRDAVAGWPVKADGEKINVCTISHFHSDHISGIPQLLKNSRCDRLVIPYYTPFQRLIIYVQSGSDDEEYRRIMEDPYGYFSGQEFNIGQIIVVRGGDEETTLQGERPKAPFPTENNNEASALINTNSDSDDYYQEDGQENDRNLQFFARLRDEDPSAEASMVKVRHLPYQLRTPLYKFIYYTLSEEDGSDADLKAKTNALRKAVDDYFAAKKMDTSAGVKSFKDLFNAVHIKEITRIYGRIFGAHKLNGTSLAVFHSFTLEPGGYEIFQRHSLGWHRLYRVGRQHATLMTGDLELGSLEKLRQFQDYYHANLDDVAYFQVMHHGSDKNWPFGFAESKLDTFPAYVINHGVGRKHHPGPEVTKLLRSKRLHNVLLNNELTLLRYFIYYGYK